MIPILGAQRCQARCIWPVSAAALAILAACTSVEGSDPTATVPATLGASPTAASTIGVTPTATLTPAPAPPPFDLADYPNGADIADLIAEGGAERPYPAELMPGAPELPEAEVRRLVHEYMADSRVVFIKELVKESRIKGVDDYCDNGTAIVRYLDARTRNQQQIFRRDIGLIRLWSVEHTELTDWNAPYVVGAIDEQRNAYITRGWDALSSEVLAPPGNEGLVKLGSGAREHIRVFDNPGCADPQPILEYRADEWELLGLGAMATLPDELRMDRPQIDPEEVIRQWDELFSGLATFSNMNGFPLAYWCGDHRGVSLVEHTRFFGIPFTWRIEDGSDHANNAIWMIYNYDNLDHSEELILLGDPEDTYRTIVAAHLEDCSVEKGLAYAESISGDGDQ